MWTATNPERLRSLHDDVHTFGAPKWPILVSLFCVSVHGTCGCARSNARVQHRNNQTLLLQLVHVHVWIEVHETHLPSSPGGVVKICALCTALVFMLLNGADMPVRCNGPPVHHFLEGMNVGP